jgi:ABC-2 type transport system permease protein
MLSYFALFAWLRPSMYLAAKVVVPIGQIVFFTFLGTHGGGELGPDYYIIGNAVQLVAISGIFGVSMSVGGERWSGTLPYLFGTPANRLAIFFGRSFIHILDGVLGALIGLGWGVIVMGLDLSKANLPSLLLVILITSFSTSGMGLSIGSLSLITRNVMFFNNTVYFLMLIVSGSNIPVQRLPEWVQTISSFIPLTRGIAATRLVIHGSPWRIVAPLLAEEIVIGMIYIGMGYVLFTWFENAAKKRGTLEVV